MTSPKAPFDVLGQLGALRRYAGSLTRDAADAEDLVHDTLVRAYERRGTFRRGGNIRAWLLSILHNTFVDRIRSHRSAAAREEQAGVLADMAGDPTQEHSVRLTQIREAFLALPEPQRAALHLVAIEGLSYQEAADALGISIGTLMSRIGRARAALRQMEEGGASAARHLRIVGGRDDESA
ncbi:RNA polymerase sigma factor [Agaricicola taiwanensis]|uniref:RNA polymerase sigma factor n=1 Tax=Agaricicola taiwanensis TaxID=591372 RepID=A0A8J2VPG2_9RHOB|nr:sigma-70 family RNA polymerase sigma factor [Agaricicola taiwanensis]GGE32977.1 RNA polymerase sigma factor [Agaricicola taiwanensis]